MKICTWWKRKIVKSLLTLQTMKWRGCATLLFLCFQSPILQLLAIPVQYWPWLGSLEELGKDYLITFAPSIRECFVLFQRQKYCASRTSDCLLDHKKMCASSLQEIMNNIVSRNGKPISVSASMVADIATLGQLLPLLLVKWWTTSIDLSVSFCLAVCSLQACPHMLFICFNVFLTGPPISNPRCCPRLFIQQPWLHDCCGSLCLWWAIGQYNAE